MRKINVDIHYDFAKAVMVETDWQPEGDDVEEYYKTHKV